MSEVAGGAYERHRSSFALERELDKHVPLTEEFVPVLRPEAAEPFRSIPIPGNEFGARREVRAPKTDRGPVPLQPFRPGPVDQDAEPV